MTCPVRASRLILVVDDDVGIRDSLVECLVSEGHRVSAVANGHEGIARLRAGERPDLVVLDLVMPVMNGAQFLAELRADPGLPRVPVLLMTAASPNGGRGLPEATGYLSKPFELDDLLDAVERFAAAE